MFQAFAKMPVFTYFHYTSGMSVTKCLLNAYIDNKNILNCNNHTNILDI